jgi:anti-sigma B factor antagonist
MDAQRPDGSGLATVSDLQARRAGRPGRSVSVSVRSHPGGCWTVVVVVGEVDVRALPLLANLVGRDASRVVFDLREVSFMDARGLGTMVEAQRRARAAGGCVRLVAPSRSVRRVMALTGCDRIFQTFGSLPEAMSAPLDTDPKPAS